MSDETLLNDFLNLGCHPFQAEFASRFLSCESSRTHVLDSSPGMGKGFTAAAICSHAWATGRAKLILVLSPSALVAQWDGMLRRVSSEVPVEVIDRRRFRELEACVADGTMPWPESGVVIMSLDFAKQADVAESLALASWDLLVIDEAHHLRPQSQRHAVVLSLLEASPNTRVLLLRGSGLAGIDTTTDPLLQGSTLTVWSRGTVRDRDGRPLLPEVQIQWVAHRRRPDEVAVLLQLEEKLRAIREPDSTTRMSASVLMQAASSSLFALEQRLNRILQQHGNVPQGRILPIHGDGGSDGVASSDTTDESLESTMVVRPELCDIASQLLQAVDGVESDSKLDALLHLLESVGRPDSRECRVCIFARFADTATYLEGTLAEHYNHVSKLTGSMSFEERGRIVQQFENNGGILIATESVSTVIPEVVAVVFYDLPRDPAVLDARVGQFVRVGRSGPVRVFSFLDEAQTLVVERLQRKLADLKLNMDDGELQRILFHGEDEVLISSPPA